MLMAEINWLIDLKITKLKKKNYVEKEAHTDPRPET